MNKKTIILIAFVTLFAAFLRFYQLPQFPVGFHIDEATLGYNAYSMLKTGKDEQGNILPLTIDVFGDARLTGYDYLTVIPVWLFGLSEFSTRFAGAFFGTLTIPVFYMLLRSLDMRRNTSVAGSLLLAVTPWHVNLSRASSETLVTVFFIVFGFALILQGLRRNAAKSIYAGSAVAGLSFFIYATPRIFVPLLVLGTIILFYKKITTDPSHRKAFLFSFFFLCALTALLVFGSKGGRNRFEQVSIFGTKETQLVIDEQIREDGTLSTSAAVSRGFHNKAVNYTFAFVSNYFDYFTGKFWFIDGGYPYFHRIPSMGLYYLVTLPFILIGIYTALRSKNAYHMFVLLWLVLAPVVAALTVDDVPNIKRSTVMFPAVEILAILGIFTVISGFKQKATSVTLMIFLLLSLNFVYFMHQYFVHGRTHQTFYRNNGFREMLNKVRGIYDQYDYFVITKSLGGAYPLVLFHMRYDPSQYQREGSPKDRDYSGFGKFIFIPQFCPSSDVTSPEILSGRTVYINNGTCKIPETQVSEKIYREDGSTAFIIEYR